MSYPPQKIRFRGPHETLFQYFIKQGLTESESRYCVNKVSNAIRQCGDKFCCDNFRFSVDGKNDRKYEILRAGGCCGFCDEVIRLKSGKTVKFGFNYGH